jgi:Flp pilus assembly pilin Flp
VTRYDPVLDQRSGYRSIIQPPTRDRLHFLRELADFGPRHTTTMVVNGRPLSLNAALRLVAQQPNVATISRRYRYLSISPDPFADQSSKGRRAGRWEGIPPTRELVSRLIERQGEIDREARGWRDWCGQWLGAWLQSPQPGQTNVELGAILVLVSIAAIAILSTIGTQVLTLLTPLLGAF